MLNIDLVYKESNCLMSLVGIVALQIVRFTIWLSCAPTWESKCHELKITDDSVYQTPFKYHNGYLFKFYLRFVGKANWNSVSPFWLVSAQLHGGAEGKCLVGFMGCLLWQFLLIKKQMLMYCNRMLFNWMYI